MCIWTTENFNKITTVKKGVFECETVHVSFSIWITIMSLANLRSMIVISIIYPPKCTPQFSGAMIVGNFFISLSSGYYTTLEFQISRMICIFMEWEWEYTIPAFHSKVGLASLWKDILYSCSFNDGDVPFGC